MTDLQSNRPTAVIERVSQRFNWDCGVACLSMVTGRPYSEVLALFNVDKVASPGYGGLVHFSILEALRELGFIGDLIFGMNQLQNRERAPWPPDPMPPVAIVCVALPAGAHYVVWDHGRILCPSSHVTQLEKVMHVIGVYPRHWNRETAEVARLRAALAPVEAEIRTRGHTFDDGDWNPDYEVSVSLKVSEIRAVIAALGAAR